MRSKFFTQILHWPNKDFREGFNALFGLDEPLIANLIPNLASIIARSDPRDRRAGMTQLISRVANPPLDLDKGLNWCTQLLFFLGSLEGESQDDLVSDFLGADLGTEDEAKLRSMIGIALEQASSTAHQAAQRILASASVVPAYSKIGIRLAYIPLLWPHYRSEESVQDYSPSCEGFAQVFEIRIDHTASDSPAYVFQCDATEIQILQRELEAALKAAKTANLALNPPAQ